MMSSVSNPRQSGSHGNPKMGRSLSRKRAGVPVRHVGVLRGRGKEATEEPMQAPHNLQEAGGKSLEALAQATCKLGSWYCMRSFCAVTRVVNQDQLWTVIASRESLTLTES